MTCGAELAQRGGQFDPDVASADHHNLIGHLGERQCRGRVQDPPAVERQPRKLEVARAAGDDRLRELEEDRRIVGGPHYHAVGAVEPSLAVHDGYPGRPQKLLDAAR